MDDFEIRRLRLAELLNSISAADLSRNSGIAASYISRCLKDPLHPDHKTIGEITARKIEAGAKKTKGWLDRPYTNSRESAEHDFFLTYRYEKNGFYRTTGSTSGLKDDLLAAEVHAGRDIALRDKWFDEITKYHAEKNAFLDERYPDGLVYQRGFLTNTEEAGRPLPSKRTPVVGTARMGDLGYYDEMPYPPGHGDGWVDSYSPDPNAYALRVKGDSMHPAIRHGSFVIVEPNGPCVPGEYVVLALIDGRKMVKELVRQNEVEIVIESVNGNHRQTIEFSEIERMHPVAAIVSASKWRAD